MKLLPAAAVLRARVALRPRTIVLEDCHGTLDAGELLDLVQLHRRRRRRPHTALSSLPATAPLRQVLVTVLAGNGVLTHRSDGGAGAPRLQRRGPLTPAQLLTLSDLARRIGLGPGRRVACLTPGVHGHGLLVALGALAIGAPLVDLSHLPGPERIALLHRACPDLLSGIPVHLSDLLLAEREQGRGRPLHISRVVSGSDALSPALRADLARQFRARVHDVYGSDATGPLAVDGRPLRGVHLREIDGLLRARTPFTGGRELVTDPGTLTAGVITQVLGSSEGALSRSAMLPDPGAVVRVLRAHPAVTQARLRMVGDERTGMRTIAEVELAPAPDDLALPTPESLQSLVRDRLGPASVPCEVRLRRSGTRRTGPG
ncbi:acyl-CoA synthetase [Brachybacterium vulturis]|uniref:Acyl-CoA synthetase n=1 Tax=Brachybacterium vulturis TaxID=2017484 RepID=A0A291GQQ9_9MICO|nr:AMP-binding protein [Brachybacterium vulturis]ATG52372.1 acyl-CoA synthetase [Brachybacterium vulturis]